MHGATRQAAGQFAARWSPRALSSAQRSHSHHPRPHYGFQVGLPSHAAPTGRRSLIGSRYLILLSRQGKVVRFHPLIASRCSLTPTTAPCEMVLDSQPQRQSQDRQGRHSTRSLASDSHVQLPRIQGFPSSYPSCNASDPQPSPQIARSFTVATRPSSSSPASMPPTMS